MENTTDSVMIVCTAPVNIAVVKYWGKRDNNLILPVNSSLSATIDQGLFLCGCKTRQFNHIPNWVVKLVIKRISTDTWLTQVWIVTNTGTMQSRTTVVASKSFAEDEMYLNGKYVNHRIACEIRMVS